MILISRTTILYIAFNLLAIQYTSIIVKHLFHYDTAGGVVGLLIAIVVFIEHIPVCMLVEKYAPILIGKRR